MSAWSIEHRCPWLEGEHVEYLRRLALAGLGGEPVSIEVEVVVVEDL